MQCSDAKLKGEGGGSFDIHKTKNPFNLQFKAKSGYVIRAGLSWSPYTATDTEP